MLPAGMSTLEVEHHTGGTRKECQQTGLGAAMWGCFGLEGFTTDGVIRLFHATHPFFYLPLPHLGGSRIRVSDDLSSLCSSNSAMNESQPQ